MNAGQDFTTKKCPELCLKRCDHHYCISERLKIARAGKVKDGLLFSGENMFKMDSILPVAEIFRRFKKQAESVYKEGIGFKPQPGIDDEDN